MLNKQAELDKAKAEEGSVTSKIYTVQRDLTVVSGSLESKKVEIYRLGEEKDVSEKSLEEAIAWRNLLLRSYYKRGGLSLLEIFLGSGGFSEVTQRLAFFKATVGEGKRQITDLNGKITALQTSLEGAEKKKQLLEGQVASLATQKSGLEARQAELKSYQNTLLSQVSGLQSDIASITARQEELIREKLSATAMFMSVGDTEEARQTLPDPPFSPAYAVASIGYPHRVGMNQYGAYGRAKAGQNYRQILTAYYNVSDGDIHDFSGPDTIEVDGYGRLSFEDNYLKGIAEMPTSWADNGGFEALKAQAVAARTYALAVTGNGSASICPTQSCQVYNPSKVTDPAASRWHDAVSETRGIVITSGGEPIKAWYASTAGGYTRLPTDFDVRWNSSPSYVKRIKDADGEGKAYDGPSYGNSPWYYRVWYAPSDTHPWLTKDEMRDLLNAALLPEEFNPNLSQPENGGWSVEQVRSKLTELGITPISDFSDIQLAHSEEGYTQLLRVSEGGGHRDIDGKRFRTIFILRSRGHLALWSSLYDIIAR